MRSLVASRSEGRFTEREGVDWTGVGAYLAITFGLTWSVEWTAVARGMRFDLAHLAQSGWIAGLVMCFPALAALIVRLWVRRIGLRGAGLRGAPWQAFAALLAAAPLVFAVSYGISWALGLAAPDATLHAFAAELHLNPAVLPASTAGSWAALAAVSVLVTPWVNALAAFGEEFGWTGYLVPELGKLGPWRAALIYGTIWGLWHAPLAWAGFAAPGHPVAGVLLMCGLTVAFGFTQVALRQRYGSVLVTSFAHGAYNAQAYGIWRVLFARANPVLAGLPGVVGIVVLGLPGIWLLSRLAHRPAAARAPAG